MQAKKLPTKYVDNYLIIKYIRENFEILSCTKAAINEINKKGENGLNQ